MWPLKQKYEIQFSDGTKALRNKPKKVKENLLFVTTCTSYTESSKKNTVVWTKTDLKNEKRQTDKNNQDI